MSKFDDTYLKKLEVPTGIVDVVLDTDAFNEIDDQFALSYLLRSPERTRVLGVLAAPFLNKKVAAPGEGMEKSYEEIKKVMKLALPEGSYLGGELPPVYRGSETFLPDEKTPVDSEAARQLVELALAHTSEKPLYIVEIAASTTVASALLMEPAICDRVVIVWLGGEAYNYTDNHEFNMRQDVAAGRVLFNSDAPLVQLPCRGVVSAFLTSRYELEHWFLGKGELADYLASNAIRHCEELSPGKPWSKPLWDVTAVAWLLNDTERFMLSRVVAAPEPQFNHTYDFERKGKPIRYNYFIKRDPLFADLIEKITKQ